MMSPNTSRQDGLRGKSLVGVLDVGTSKIACLIGAPVSKPRAGEPPFNICGIGHQRSQGLKAGVITDVEAAERAVRAAVSQAERMAGVELDEIVLAVSCGRLKSHNFTANADISTGIVADADIHRVMSGGRAYAERDGRSLVHLDRYGFRLDGATGVRDPRGMAARRLAADLHAVTADEAPICNLMLAVERCHLGVAGLVAAPYASALAVTSEEERRLGVTCIDIGAGTTSVAVFADGRFVYTDVVAVGGQHISMDIARALRTPLAEAERIKALYGTLVGASSDEHEIFSYPLAGDEEGETCQITKAELSEVVRARMAGIAELAADRLAQANVAAYAADRVVLTGGSSQLIGAAEFMANAFGRPVRLGRPSAASGVAAALANPAFATAQGLFAAIVSGAGVMMSRRNSAGAVGYLSRVSQWLREGF